MHIVVNSIYLQGSHPDNSSFIEELFVELANKYSEHHFYFLVNKGGNHQYPTSANATIVTIEYTIKSIASLKIWMNLKLLFILKKLQANVLIQPNGLCSFTTSIPQILFISDLIWLQKPLLLQKSLRLYYRFFGSKGIGKAGQIITFSNSIKQQLINQYPNTATKISVIGGAVSIRFQPVSQEKKLQTRDGYADGRNYFLFVGRNNPGKNLEGVIKAFSSFKRWQKSNMKLLVSGIFTFRKEDVINKLSSYKYKDDVVVLKSLTKQQMVDVTGSAYAIINSDLYDGFAIPIISGLQSGVPVIASKLNSIMEVAGDSCLYAAPNDVDEIANMMKQLYKDEQLYALLREKGLQITEELTWKNATDTFWGVLLKAISVKS